MIVGLRLCRLARECRAHGRIFLKVGTAMGREARMPATRARRFRWLALGAARVIVSLGAGLPSNSWAASAPEIRWVVTSTNSLKVVAPAVSDGELRAFERLKTDHSRAGVFGVFAEQAGSTDVPPMLGAWQVAGKALNFEPRFPLTRGVRYRAELRLPGAAPVISHFTLPVDDTESTTVVTQVYPSGTHIPENQLKFYLHFSAPMARGSAYRHVQIRAAGGALVDLPFLELEEELWDPAMTRLTLLIDPGRIKRGVKPLEDIGPVFEAGKTYFLEVSAGWRDAAGRPLKASSAQFNVGPADRTSPDPARWKIRPPKVDTTGSLVLEFDEPMDHALAGRLISVHAAASRGGEFIDGENEVGGQERSWVFTPKRPWARGAYALQVVTTIEDLAGNNIGKTFDVDLTAGGQSRLERRSVSVSFEIK